MIVFIAALLLFVVSSFALIANIHKFEPDILLTLPLNVKATAGGYIMFVITLVSLLFVILSSISIVLH